LGKRARIGDGIGDRLVEKDMLARLRRGDRGFAMHRIRRGVDDRLDAAVVQYFLERTRCAAAVLGGEFLALFRGAAVAGGDAELPRALDRISEHVRPPAHADARHLHLIDSAASLATRSSNCQSPPATPTAPM